MPPSYNSRDEPHSGHNPSSIGYLRQYSNSFSRPSTGVGPHSLPPDLNIRHPSGSVLGSFPNYVHSNQQYPYFSHPTNFHDRMDTYYSGFAPPGMGYPTAVEQSSWPMFKSLAICTLTMAVRTPTQTRRPLHQLQILPKAFKRLVLQRKNFMAHLRAQSSPNQKQVTDFCN